MTKEALELLIQDIAKKAIKMELEEQIEPRLKPHKTIDRLLQDTMVSIHSKDILPADETLLRTIENKVLQLRGDVNFGGKEFKDYNADELSRIAGDLAIYKVNLGELYSRVDFYREMSEQYAKAKKASLRNIAVEQVNAKKVLRQGNEARKATVDEINDELYALNLPAKAIFAVRQEFATRCLYLWRSVNSLLDVMSQRINLLTSERADTRFYDSNTTDNNVKESPIQTIPAQGGWSEHLDLNKDNLKAEEKIKNSSNKVDVELGDLMVE